MSAAIIQMHGQRRVMDDDKPALGDGYTRIVNDILEAFAAFPLSSMEFRVVMAIFRKTFGYRKAKDRIAASQLAEMMGEGVTRQKASSTLARLIQKNVVIREGGSQSAIKINTRSHEWIRPTKKTRAPESANVNRNCKANTKNGSPNPKTVHKTNPITVHTKEKRNTDSNAPHYLSVQSTGRDDDSNSSEPPEQSKPMKPGAVVQTPNGRKWGEQIDVELAELMAKTIDGNTGQDAPANRNMISWANEIRLMRERDERPADAIRALFAWSQQHHFWHRNILSPDKLRKQWTRLAMERNDERKNREGGSHETRRKGTGSAQSELSRQQTDINYAIENF